MILNMILMKGKPHMGKYNFDKLGE